MIVLVFSLLSIPQPGFSQTVYKCTDSSGTTIFGDTPCATDAEELYLQDTQSGILAEEPGEWLEQEASKNQAKEDRRETSRIDRVNAEAEREFNRRIEEGWDSKSAQRAANVVLSKIDNPNGEKAQREFNRRIEEGWDSKSAQRASDVVSGRMTPDVSEDEYHSGGIPTAIAPPDAPIPSTSGGFFIPVAGGYMAPNGGGFCSEAAGGMFCDGQFIPVVP